MKKNLRYLFLGLSFIFALSPLQSRLFAQRINDLTGINAHANLDPITAQAKFTWVREWHDWSTDVGFDRIEIDPNGNLKRVSDGKTTCFSMDDPRQWPIHWNPTYNPTGTQTSMDDYYGQLSATANVIPVLKGIAPPFRGYTNYYGFCGYQMEAKPTCPTNEYSSPNNCFIPILNSATKEFVNLPNSTAQTFNPNVFQEHALWLSLYAAKFGWPLYSPQQVAAYVSGQEVKIGKQYITFLEDNNETNKTWWERSTITPQELAFGQTYWYFTPQQYANMFSADYDGHKSSIMAGNNGTLNPFKVGVSNAADGVTLAQAGTTGLNGAYYEQMYNHWRSHRQGDIPPIIANFHHYCTNLSAQQNDNSAFLDGEYRQFTNILLQNGAGTGVGVCPEEDRFRDKLVWLRDGLEDAIPIAPQEYWISEFGYDSFEPGYNESGVEVDPALNGGDAERTQGQWLVRGVLEAAGSGVVDKMMLYNMSDDPEQGINSYARSGLLTADGAKKKSWYYVMTLKNVLGEHEFVKEIEQGTDNISIATTGNRPFRIYAFDRNSGDRIYVIWSPTASDENYTMDITFNDPDFILSGANVTQIQDLSEKGIRRNWTTNGNTVTNLPISETPIFLKVNKAESETPEILPLNSLSCAPLGCNGVNLSWVFGSGAGTTKINQITQTVRIFYRAVDDCNSACAPFDYQDVTAYPFNAGVNHTSIAVTGLLPGSYCFYAIPVGLNGNIPLNGVVRSCCTTVGGQTSCITPISSTEIDIDPNWTPDDIATFNLILGTGGTPSCNELYAPNPTECNNPVENGWGSTASESFVVNFSNPKLLNAVYIQDWIGAGGLKIEYQRCDCPNMWWDLTTIQLQGGAYCDAHNVPILQSYPLNVLATAIRVTRLSSGASIRRIFFCGEDAECPAGRPISMGDAKSFQADEIRPYSALLRWEAAVWDTESEIPLFMDKYQLRISENVLEDGALAEPVTEIDVLASSNEMEAMYRLQGLLPGTKYYADIVPVTETIPCDLARFAAPVRTSFSTESLESTERKNRVAPSPRPLQNNFSVEISPNPSAAITNLRLSEGRINRVVLMDISGQLLEDKAVSDQESTSLDFSSRPNGLYWAKVVRTDGAVKTVQIVKGGARN